MTTTPAQARAALSFSCIGHLYAHVFEPIFYIVALVLPGELGLPYEQVLALIIAAKLLYGVLAPAAGWLGDRWSTLGMMAVFFIGLGLSAMAVGLTDSALGLSIALAATGLFGSIYHPVGISWLLRNAVDKGKAIGFNGVFGGIGPAVAGLIAGGLIETIGWRHAFILPGAAVVLTGLVFLWFLHRGLVVETKADRAPTTAASKGDTIRAGIVLTVTMLCAGLIYQATQPALPKLFSERLDGSIGVAGAAFAVTAVYLVAGLMQVVAGHLADRYPAKTVYMVAALVQAPLLALVAWGSGLPLVAASMLAVVFNMAGIPAENLLLNKYTPAKWRGTAFGLKFVLSFGVSGLAVPLVSLIRGMTGGFELLFLLLAGSAVMIACTATLLPSETPKKAAAPEGAAAE
ncbi:putative major facilitator superfamily, general substrate transporter [Magnetospirillum gryphiswaldense MSR-1 v2]|uniref:Major facilitator superfamily, general substrate transporter n=1 Tax=Magnetospirillum gryphiswaldense (strain DSM 6361 / JCM 21280 / NBRC 15271 / MSR-1) TaxID=431944 RepID=V6F1D4_MAGGM|nr:MFS transporter [Magnetospirillum gryphiswaldense]CDK99320.1 putative major facilitator superfamily, general substrate transporter [Magnetospirillum gryphiswaldense MSR-1 v2]